MHTAEKKNHFSPTFEPISGHWQKPILTHFKWKWIVLPRRALRQPWPSITPIRFGPIFGRFWSFSAIFGQLWSKTARHRLLYKGLLTPHPSFPCFSGISFFFFRLWGSPCNFLSVFPFSSRDFRVRLGGLFKKNPFFLGAGGPIFERFALLFQRF